jgi:hypothetical protein
MAAVVPMPGRGDRSAPHFDPQQPRELRRYFSDLDFVFGRAGVTDNADKKAHACRYVNVDTSELWETLPEYADIGKSYQDFVAAVHALYPGSDEERKWSVADMDKLVGERSRLGIISLSDLGEYYRQFLAITTFLRSKSRLSEGEQSRAFVRGFPVELWQVISQRLQLLQPNHFPDDPYSLVDIHEAAKYVLHGTPAMQTLMTTSATAATSSPVVPVASTGVKTEDLAAILERITESFVKALAVNRPPRPPMGTVTSGSCHFCNEMGHMARDCAHCAEYIAQGKCKRNIEGRIVLASGAFIPRDVPGTCFKERIDEWHRRNPGQQAAAQMIYNVMSQAVATDTAPVLATRQTHPNLFIEESVATPPLSLQDRIQSLERELFTLRKRQGNVARPSGVNERGTSVDIPEDEPRRKQVLRPEVVIPRTKPATKVATVPTPPVTEPAVAETIVEPPTHPYAEAPDATYAPPSNRNFAALPKQAPPKKNEPAYRTLPSVYDGKIATDVYDRAMAAQVTLTQRELLSLSPEVRSQVRDATSARRTATNKDTTKDTNILDIQSELAAAIDDINDDEASDVPTATFLNTVGSSSSQPPPGALVIPDPYETYLKSLPEGVVPEQLVVAKESSALRSIHPLVHNQQHVESIIDPGSQIIAMSEDVCMDLALIYDPTIILNMQSANGDVDKSLGLARNVPIRIGEITLYIQIHVIRSPAYDILLGRPFDVLTESVVRNFANEDQTITIRDPNSGLRATIPTTPRGRPRHILKRPSFMTSMI